MIDPNFGLVENKHTGRKFGNYKQVTILGWSGKYRSAKVYILRCTECGKDSELYGEGYFKSTLPNLDAGKLPCGCAKSRKDTEENYIIKAKRVCDELGLSFMGWADSFSKSTTNTKCRLKCPVHGEYTTTSLNSLLNQKSGCRKCTRPVIANRFRKSDSQMRLKFLSTGVFHPDTIFERSEETNHLGHKPYWLVTCPVCKIQVSSNYSNLSVGKIPCECSYQEKMTEGYVNIISDGGVDIAIKFGISSSSNRRLKEQDRRSIYDIRQVGVWKFLNFIDCRFAEQSVKKSLDCGIVGKNEMPDGYTETTHLYNLDEVISIYEKNGGVRVND